MKISTLLKALEDARLHIGGDPEVALCFEGTAIEDGFNWDHTEGISDVRVCQNWALPGESMITHEADKPYKVVLFYDNHFNLDSAKDIV